MQGYGLRFHHLGLAVPAPDQAFRFLESLGYQPGAQTFDPLQNVNLAMRHHGAMPDVEVIWPGDGPSPIDQMIKRGNMIYHMCFETDDAEATIAALEADGLRVFSLGAPKPARLFGGVPVSFHRVDQVGLIELIHGVPQPALP
ncbi:MAG TPA: VOC family protein [Acetobacteraceae bacterium]|nr:VOC family protein [Acetobacteraceae bacterium]